MEKLAVVLGLIVAWIGVIFLMAYPTMWCWNYLMPKLFGLITIDFTDALVMNLLCSVLFQSSRTHSSK